MAQQSDMFCRRRRSLPFRCRRRRVWEAITEIKREDQGYAVGRRSNRSNRITGVLSAAAPNMERHDVRDAPDAADQIGRQVKCLSYAHTIDTTIAYCVCWRRGSRVVSTVYPLLRCWPSSTPRPSLSPDATRHICSLLYNSVMVSLQAPHTSRRYFGRHEHP